MSDTASFWDKAAPKYAKRPISDPEAYAYTLERTQSHLTPTDRVLEIGCGTGSTALLLAPYAAHVTGTDISAAMIGIAKQKAQAEGAETVEFSVSPGVPAEASYDVVLAFNLLHLLPDMDATLQAIHAVLPKGGLFISKSPCLSEKSGGVKGVLVRAMIAVMIPVLRLTGKAPYVRSFDIATLEAAVTAAGFEIIETSNHPKGPPPARYIVARKA